MILSAAASRSTAPGPSPAPSLMGSSPAAISRCGSEPCGGCCMRPPPAPTSCWNWRWLTWIWPTGGRGFIARVARSSGCCGRPGRRSCSLACWPAGPPGQSSWVAAGQPTRSPGWTWIRPAGGPAVVPAAAELFRVRTGVDAAPAAPFGSHPRRRGRHQPAAATGPLPPRLGAVPGALCPPRAGGGCPPPRRDRPSTPATMTRPHHISRPAAGHDVVDLIPYR